MTGICATIGRGAQQLEAFFAHALETVRRRARLERATANDFGAAIGHDIGGALNLVAALHTAGAGHYDDVVAADFNIANADDSALRTKTAACQFVRRDDAMDFFHAIENFEDSGIEIRFAADAADHGVDSAGGTVNVEAVFDEPIHHALNLLRRGVLLHDN